MRNPRRLFVSVCVRHRSVAFGLLLCLAVTLGAACSAPGGRTANPAGPSAVVPSSPTAQLAADGDDTQGPGAESGAQAVTFPSESPSDPVNSGPAVIGFPPRNEPNAFFQDLTVYYRDVLRRPTTATYVDGEGENVWLTEYFRFSLNGCSHAESMSKTIREIQFGGTEPICGKETPTFPPRNLPFEFQVQLEATYRDVLRRPAIQAYVDSEGANVWLAEYLRFRVSSCDHTTARTKVLTEIGGGGVQPPCSAPVATPPSTTPPTTPPTTPTPTTTLTGTVVVYLSLVPLPGVTVSAQGRSTTTGANGRFSLAGLSRGTVSVSFTLQGYEEVTLPITLTTANQELPFSVDLSPTSAPPAPTATLRGLVSEAGTLTPLSGVTVTAATVGFGGGSSRITTTGSDGRYVLTGLAPGQVTVSATRQGYVTATQNVTLAGGSDTTANFTLTRTPAASLTGYEIVSSANVSTGGPGIFGEAVATCPGTKRVLGGGADTFSGVDGNWRVVRSRPEPDGSGWRVAFIAVRAGEQVRAVAVCATVPDALGYEVVQESVTTGLVGTQPNQQIVAACPGSKRVLGGGFTSANVAPEVWRVWRSYAASLGEWAANFTSVIQGENVRTVAVCASVPDALGIEIVTSADQQRTPLAGTSFAAAATCPAGKRVLGGGFFANGGEVWRVYGSNPNPTGTAWEVDATSLLSGFTYYAQAVCGIVP